jgi:hypothetical protein
MEGFGDSFFDFEDEADEEKQRNKKETKPYHAKHCEEAV